MIELKRVSHENVYEVLKQRYVTVFLDMPANQPIDIAHGNALREIELNVLQLLTKLRDR